jgi:DNA-binding winged helix-turn-helix (wHTH) protein/Tol biopolymer transport system component
MSQSEKRLYEFGEFRLDPSGRLLSRRGVNVPLTPKAVDVLVALVEQAGRLLDKDTLLTKIWPDTFVEESNLADNVFKLRRALGDGENGGRFIETVPKRGYRFVGEVRVVGEPTVRDSQPAAVDAQPWSMNPRRRLSAGWLVAGVMALVAITLAVGALRRSAPEPPMRILRASLLPPAGASFGDIAVSPDGKWLAFTAATGSRMQLWLHSLTTGEATAVPGTDGASNPFWAPDSRFLGFFAVGRLKKVEVGGGLPVTLCQASVGTGGTWNRDGVILFTVLGVPQIQRVPAVGGKPEIVLRADTGQTDLHEPFFLPDGRRFLYLAISGGRKDAAGIFVGALDGTVRQRLLEHDSNALFVAGDDAQKPERGYLLFGREGGLMAQAFDADALRLSGEATPIATRVGTVPGNLSYRRRNFTASGTGLLIYDPQTGRQRSQLLWVDRAGKPLRRLEHLEDVSVAALSPNESRIVVARKDLTRNDNDLWLTDAAGSSPVRFTFDPGSDLLGLWSPDGRRIVWTSTRNGSFDLYEKAVDGTGKDTPMLQSAEPKFPLDWSRDGRYLLYRQIDPRTNHDIFVLSMEGERKPVPYLQTLAIENGGAFSPDGKWIAYSSDESGRVEVYVERFPTHGGKRQISLAGGGGPRWRADGKELYFHALDGALMAVSVTDGGAALTTGAPTTLFAFRAAAAVTVPSYSPARDGQRFLLTAVVESDAKAPLSVVLGWTSGFGINRRR